MNVNTKDIRAFLLCVVSRGSMCSLVVPKECFGLMLKELNPNDKKKKKELNPKSFKVN
jgi:hypothetical protein